MAVTSDNTFFNGHDEEKIEMYQIVQNDGKKHPSIIVVHEIWGLEDNIRSISNRFGDLGYNVFAPHLFSRFGPHFTSKNIEGAMQKFFSIPEAERWTQAGMQKALESTSDEEKQIIQTIFASRPETTKTMIKDLKSLVSHIGTVKTAYPDRVGTVGFCLGGGLIFQLATEAPVNATCVFYGSNPEPLADISKIKGEIMASYASEDARVNEGIPAMMQEFIKNQKEIELKIYGGAKHAFFNDLRQTFHPVAAVDSWQRAIAFFARVLGE